MEETGSQSRFGRFRRPAAAAAATEQAPAVPWICRTTSNSAPSEDSSAPQSGRFGNSRFAKPATGDWERSNGGQVGGRFDGGGNDANQTDGSSERRGRFGANNNSEGGGRFGSKSTEADGAVSGGRPSGRFGGGQGHEEVSGAGDSSEQRGGCAGDSENGSGRPKRSGSPAIDGTGGDGEERAPITYVPPDPLSRDEQKHQHNVPGINFKKYGDVKVHVTGENVPKPVQDFKTSGLHALMLGAAEYMEYSTPTPIQKHSIPAILAKRDVMGCAQTGSGKTAGYLFPIISNLINDGVTGATARSGSLPEVLIVCPTRELASQVDKEAALYVEGSGLKTFAVYGQTEMRYMSNRLRAGVNIISATTGRLKQALEMKLINLEKLQYLVLDEADRMLDMGFAPEIEAIVGSQSMPKNRITLMFSATFPNSIQDLARRFLNDYLFIVTGVIGGACGDVQQDVRKCEGRAEKKEALEEILNERKEKNHGQWEKTLVFCETKEETDKIGLELAINGIPSTTIHGNRTQEQRERALADFKSNKKAVLVATNVAARGLDIPDCKHVVNWDLPRTPDDMDEYVHRIGRTGRLGNQGLATTFYSSRNCAVVNKLISILEKSGTTPPEWLYEEAGMSVPSGNRNAEDTGDRFNSRDTRRTFTTESRNEESESRISRFGGEQAEKVSSIPCRWDSSNQNAGDESQKESLYGSRGGRFSGNDGSGDATSSNFRFGGDDRGDKNTQREETNSNGTSDGDSKVPGAPSGRFGRRLP